MQFDHRLVIISLTVQEGVHNVAGSEISKLTIGLSLLLALQVMTGSTGLSLLALQIKTGSKYHNSAGPAISAIYHRFVIINLTAQDGVKDVSVPIPQWCRSSNMQFDHTGSSCIISLTVQDKIPIPLWSRLLLT